MSSIGGAEPGTAEDQAYFRRIEEAFLALRGRATLLSAEDWRVAQGWHRAGVPAELVVAVMEQLFARQRERKSKRGISSLRYFRRAVEAAWDEMLALTAGARALPERALSASERLAALADALPGEPPEARAAAAQVRSLDGPLDRIETELARIEAELLEGLGTKLDEGERREMEQRIARALESRRGELSGEELATLSERLRRQELRRRFGLPMLSLFAPEANPENAPDVAS
jgi:hypothetical protein